MSDILLHEVKGKSEIITFNNPNKLNVLFKSITYFFQYCYVPFKKIF